MRWLLFVLVAGCTTANPHFHSADLGDKQGPSPTDGNGITDGSSTTPYDGSMMMSGVDMTGPPTVDLSMPSMMCAQGPRKCSFSGSEACTDGKYTLDRMCPWGSMCSAGYCQPPLTAKSCTMGNATSETFCASGGPGMGSVCEPFVGSGTVVWDCVAPTGQGTAGQACTSGSQCRSGICADNLCFRVCATDSDCPKQVPTCQDVTIVVEGVMIDTHGCVP